MNMANEYSRSVARTLKNRFIEHAVALLAVAVALLVCGALSPPLRDSLLYVLLFPAIAFSAWYCGLWPSVVSILVAFAGIKYWFIPPIHSFVPPDTVKSIGMLAFLFACGLLVILGEARRRANEGLRRSQVTLEDRVKERTAELDSANQSLRDLTGRLLRLQDEERRRFARELHDSVGQVLAALSMNLNMARTEIERLARTADVLSESETLVQEMSKEVRTISHLLHPPLLDEAGLSSALRWYVEGFAGRSKIDVDLEFAADLGRFSQDVETAVFRTVQESLTNIHRHSGSSIAETRIAHQDGVLRLEISDRGKGIPPERLMEMGSTGLPGVGIRGMRERIRQLGGSLDVDSGSNGTIIRVRLPVSHRSSITAS
jgi:signal transduction histidine kinase